MTRKRLRGREIDNRCFFVRQVKRLRWHLVNNDCQGIVPRPQVMPQTSPNKFKDPKRGAETKIALTISGGQCHHYKNATGSFTALGIISEMRRIRACFGTSEVPIVFFGIPRTFSICFAKSWLCLVTKGNKGQYLRRGPVKYFNFFFMKYLRYVGIRKRSNLGYTIFYNPSK